MLRRVAHQYLALLLMAVCTVFVFGAWALYELIDRLASTGAHIQPWCAQRDKERRPRRRLQLAPQGRHGRN